MLMLQIGKLRSREGTILASGPTASKMKDPELNHRFAPPRSRQWLGKFSSPDKMFREVRGQDKDWRVLS